MTDRIGVLTVLHPGSLPYFRDFLAGCDHQTDRDFDLVVVVDGCAPDLDLLVPAAVQVTGTGDFAENRMLGLRVLREHGCGWFIGADSDDVMAPDRVAQSRDSLQRWPAGFFGALIPFQREPLFDLGRALAPLADGGRIGYADLLDGNPFGLGNCCMPIDPAIKILRQLIASELPALDWALATAWTYGGHHLGYVHGAATAYRQHVAQQALGAVTLPQDCRRLLDVRRKHHRHFADMDPAQRLRGECCDRLLEAPPGCIAISQRPGWWWSCDVVGEAQRLARC